MSWKIDLAKARRLLRRDERVLRARLADVQDKILKLERILSGKPRRLSPKGRAAVSRAAKKRWREYRAQKN